MVEDPSPFFYCEILLKHNFKFQNSSMIFYVVVFECLTIVGENKRGCPDDLCDDLLADKEC